MAGNEWAKEVKDALTTLIEKQRELLEECNRTVTEKLKAFAVKNDHQMADEARKIVEDEVLRLSGLLKTHAAKDAGSSSSMRVRLSRTNGLATSVTYDVLHISRKVGRVTWSALEGLAAIKSSAVGARVNEDEFIDVVDDSTPISSTPSSPPPPSRGRVRVRSAYKEMKEPITKKMRTE